MKFSRCPEFAIADGIIHLTSQDKKYTSLRLIEVAKLRGCAYTTGRHFFDISQEGFLFYPRVTAPNVPSDGEMRATPLPTGVPGLDELIGGGLPERSATIVQGATGTGEDLLGLHFLLEGIRRREPGILFTLEETPNQLRGIARNYGWALADLERDGLLALRYSLSRGALDGQVSPHRAQRGGSALADLDRRSPRALRSVCRPIADFRSSSTRSPSTFDCLVRRR